MIERYADELQPGDRFIIKGEKGERVATVQKIERMIERDLLPVEVAKWASVEPIVMIYVYLDFPIPIPGVPGWRSSLWNVWRYPGEKIALL